MKDTQYLRDLIFGFAILTPISCQIVSPTPQDPEVEVKRDTKRSPEEVAVLLSNHIHFVSATIKSASYKAEQQSRRDLAASDKGYCLSLPEVYAIQKSIYDSHYQFWQQGGRDFGGTRASKPAPLPKSLKTCPAYLQHSFSGTGCGATPVSTLHKSTATQIGLLCCYVRPPAQHQMPCGRLYLVEETATTASIEEATSWMASAVSGPHDLPQVLAMRAAEAWLEDALEEHASIAAFSRATLELMALGAPADLLAEYQAASLDEIRHAKMCFSLASALLGRDVSAGPIDVEGPRADLDEIIADIFWGGCVGESAAALCAQRALQRCTWPPARRALQEIAQDEARHAAMAWSTLSFLGARFPERVRRLLAGVRPDHLESPEAAPHDAWAALGRLTPAENARATQDAWAHLISPMLEELLG